MDEGTALLAFLRTVPFFAPLPDEELSSLLPSLHTQECRRREVIYLQGDPSKSVYLIRSGIVRLSRLSSEGRELTLFLLRRGDLFGELGPLDTATRDVSAEALEGAQLLVVHPEQFLALLRSHPALGILLCGLVGQRLRCLEEKLQGLVFKDVAARLAEALVRLSQDFGRPEGEATVVAIRLTHLDLAHLIGSTRETVSATLNAFRRNQLIAIRQRRIALLDRGALALRAGLL